MPPPEHPRGVDPPRILVVENDDDVRLMVQAALVDAYWLFEARSVEEGQRKAHIEHPDLVLIDQGLPGCSAETLRRLREGRGDATIPVLLLAEEGILDPGLGEEAALWLSRPFDPVELEAKIATLLGREPQHTSTLLPRETLSRIETQDRAVEVPCDTDASTVNGRGRGTTKASKPGSKHGAPLEPGDTITERYRVLELLGRGGMGEVYRVQDTERERELALKLIRADRGDKKDRRRFLQEAHVAAALDHEGVVTVHHFGTSGDGRLFFVMDYCSGGTLADLMRREVRLSPRRAVGFTLQILDALAAAHRQGIVHRDIKPGNVMLDADDRLRILDFGLARDLLHTEGSKGLPAAGTPLYMSPEQVRGEPSDQRTDLYSVGVLLYELISGDPPFMEAASQELLRAHLSSVPRSLCYLDDVPPQLDAAVLKALAKDRRQRWQTAGEFAAALRALDL